MSEPMRFRKKPVVIEAWQATGPREMGRIEKWIRRNGGVVSYRPLVLFGPALDISTLEGTMKAGVGDWVIRGVQGEFYPCKADIFEATYEPVGLGGGETGAQPAENAVPPADSVATDSPQLPAPTEDKA